MQHISVEQKNIDMAQRIALFNDTSVTNHYGCTAVMHNLVDALTRRGVSIAYRWPVAVDWQSHAHALANINVDGIIINGEGSIHHSLDRPRARQLCALGPFARDTLGVPAHLLNASIEALEPQEIENLRSFATITVRDHRSQNYLANHGIISEVAGDLSLSTQATMKASRSGILVTDSVLRNVSATLQKRAKVSGARFESMRYKLPLLQRLERKLIPPSLPIITPLDMRQLQALKGFMDRLAKAEAVLTGRFHSVCLCLLTKTPVLAVPSNSHKITGLLEDVFGTDSRVIKIAALPDLADGMAQFVWTSAEKIALEEFLHRSRTVQAAIFNRIVA